MEEDTYLMVFQGDRKTWMSGKKLWRSGLTSNLSFTLIVLRKSLKEDLLRGEKQAGDQMITKSQLSRG